MYYSTYVTHKLFMYYSTYVTHKLFRICVFFWYMSLVTLNIVLLVDGIAMVILHVLGAALGLKKLD